MSACVVCGGGGLSPVLDLRQVPLFCNVLHPDATTARRAERGDLHLVFCRRCTHLFNAAFDPSRLDYTDAYENSLHFSPRFREWARELAGRLTERHRLAGRTIVDVGCGRGDFLRLLCEVADARGVGFDRAHGPTAPETGPRVRFVDAFVDADTPRVQAHLVTCRHVLEHLADPVAFLAGLGGWIGAGSGVPLYLEVPNARHTLERVGIWDLIYEHASLFTEVSLPWAARRAGFEPTPSWEDFDGQYLALEARPGSYPPASEPVGDPGTARNLARAAETFGHRMRERIQAWEGLLDGVRSRGERWMLWGAGSKGVTFLNLLDPGDAVAGIVDVNPRKWGRFVAGTGHPVVGPRRLAETPPDGIVVMNPLYLDEIAATVRGLGLDVPLHTA